MWLHSNLRICSKTSEALTTCQTGCFLKCSVIFVLAMKSGSVCQDCTQRTPRNSVVSVQNYLNKVNMSYSLCVFAAFVTDIPVGEPQTLCGVRKYLPHTKDLPGQVKSLSHFAAELWQKREHHTHNPKLSIKREPWSIYCICFCVCERVVKMPSYWTCLSHRQ